MDSSERIAVVGLGYVGLPLAIALAAHFEDVVGFDVSRKRVECLARGEDWTGEVDTEVLRASRLKVSADPASLRNRTFYAVTVPTPVDSNHRPDLGAVEAACRTIAAHMTPGAIVSLESTVYPGVTEEVCGPLLSEVSGLVAGEDFKLAYSPERINPGDHEHVLERIVKVVSAQDAESLDRVATIYGSVTSAGVYRASSIKVAEAAKVIENTQRDLNIALMNEFAIIFDRMAIPTRDVLAAAATKWNFLSFSPGLVGGHCIGIDPYYLTAKAEEVGYNPEVILSGRRINDGMGAFVAGRVVKMLGQRGRLSGSAKVGILGLTFKENVRDLRNSRVPDIVKELREYGIEALVHDPMVDPAQAEAEFGIKLADACDLMNLHALVLCVPHRSIMMGMTPCLTDRLVEGGILVDVKSALEPATLPPSIHYWSL
ncbi:nucleotide sugar dehydrogenase [Pelagibius marinus]|uniref:nucleotide sugar dehydrogenase n=1 Tax=Pelagibius marinus TaxID=2762760 RepID=UPI00187323E7|nr:nucleotide sugar dehydrogenase [Pelagibius marinus]